MIRAIVWILAGVLACVGAPAAELSGEASVEGRLYLEEAAPAGPNEAAAPGQYRGNVSVSAQPEFYHRWQDGRQSFTATLFGRFDQHDSRRTHADVREFTWQYNAQKWELRTGIRKVFWGVAESKHLVDIINQTDLIEDLDGEDKLGQPMMNFAWIDDWGSLDFYVLPGFRKRRHFGAESRPGAPFVIDDARATFESGVGRGHVDWAVRWFKTAGMWDIGVSHFHGTSREPRFFASENGRGEFAATPHYDLIDQTGLDLQMTQGGWLWKLEMINRSGQGDRFFAATGGFEYTFPNVKGSGADIGVLAEYNYDERGDEALTPLEDDIFLGARLALNDIESTELLAGAALDRESGAAFVIVEANRRFGSRWTLDVRARSFIGVPAADLFLVGIANDDYVQATWSLHF